VKIGPQQIQGKLPAWKNGNPIPEDQDTADLVDAINHRLGQLLPDEDTTPRSLREAMAFSLLAPGKRLRPLLTILTSMHFGGRDLIALDAACAIEMVHTASLILDDLPAMDDGLIRRGKPTAHRAFGEDIAILSSVALLNHAFGILATHAHVPAETRTELVRVVTAAIGTEGLIGGQVLDLKLRSKQTSADDLGKINGLKTAALFSAAAEAGAIVAGVKAEMLQIVQKFALELGSAFQIADDLLDDPTYAETTGKDTGKDRNKPTILSARGKDDAQLLLHTHLEAARRSLERTGSSDRRLAAIIDRGFARFLS
jgi:geranylgeranyl diphosphate synthase type II